MEMTEMLTPSILLSETHFPLLGIRGILADAIARIADERFFGCIELTTIADGNERRRIGQIVRENGLILNLWMSLVLAEEGLNLSALDESLRKRSVRRVADHIPQSTECGATALAVLSGPDPGPLYRAEASQRLCLSLCELSDAASAEGSLKVLLEPLDRGAHRNGLIGPTDETISLVERIRSSGYDIGISWDTGHMALCGEDLFKALLMAKDYICQIHLSNAILDRSQEGFGDHHMMIGRPGFLDLKRIAEIFNKALDVGLFGPSRPGVTVEVRTLEDGDPWQTVQHCRSVLVKAWQLTQDIRTNE